ncbi:alpha/beta fold hydrolase [Jiangella mangrovi]|uniref:Pimeloyl-ACP methyl ester carboxylesterase n=1 Tax=Jiangella mangrovi TaxID=1524084 RepID=A0A7W9GN44_9ACTN|nr:alpha/beta hydrolase [Jiangella mangrovi]MBB5786855.1 pimeloyl-ACP methyl ester carboxylesterase [Jiangella mangrovi]
MTSTLMPGVVQTRHSTPRLTVNTLTVEGRDDGEPVVFVHGNVSSGVFWQRAMVRLPDRFRPVAVDLRGFGGTDTLPVDATRGVRDYADDVAGLLDTLGLDGAHLVGWSMGAAVVLQQLLDAPARYRSVTLVNPVSPYGFGATRGADGALADASAAGSGGGAANPDFVARLRDGDRGDDAPTSPRQVMLAAYFKPPFVPPADEVEAYLDSMLTTAVGDDHYPGDSVATSAWPGLGPGTRGVLNTMAPTHLHLDGLDAIDPKPPIRWIRGSDDVIVSDTSLFDLAYLGSLGVVPGWPGADVAPPQPMLAQTRAVLEKYRAAGGVTGETVIDDAGHSPHVEKPDEFVAALVSRLDER